MICSSCRRKLFSHLTSTKSARYTPIMNNNSTLHQKSPVRYATNSSSQAGTTPSPRQDSASSSTTPSALSSSTPGISQPLSTPEFPSTKPLSTPPSTPPLSDPKTVKVKSSVAGGQELRGLGYLKTRTIVLAKEDDEYPDWLWTILDKDAASAEGKGPDLASMTKKQRLRYEKKQAALQANLPKQVPLHEQSINLTKDDATPEEHQAKAAELTKSMRRARRKGIRDDNYLRGM
ncbi:MAG: hypothetical protein Q9227_006227 [Pyrenula ochraceoflavens]